MDPEDGVIIRVATDDDQQYAKAITIEMEASAKIRGTGIAKRSPASIQQKIREGKAVIAVTDTGRWVGFSYIEIWSKGEFVSNSGLIVDPAFRGQGIARLIKEKVFALSRVKYANAKIFSITTGLAIIKLNASLGFETVTYQEITKDPAFWQGCQSCVNFDILQRKCCTNCLCTAMLFTPAT